MTWTSSFLRLANKIFYAARRRVNKAIDAAFIIKTPAGLQHAAVILHGDSCTGKSTILRRLKRRYAGCTYMEADDLQYWNAADNPNLLKVALKLLADAGVDKDKSKALVRSIEEFSQLPGMAFPPHRVMVELLKTCLSSDAVIATCGNLPPPHGDCVYYQLLEECTDKVFSHVLLAPDKTELAKRIRSRGMAAQMDTRIVDNDWRIQNREYYDLVLTGNESTARILELIRASIR